MKNLSTLFVVAAAVSLGACNLSTDAASLFNDATVTTDVANVSGDAIATSIETMLANEATAFLPSPPALATPPDSLSLETEMQREAWRYIVSFAGRPIRTAGLASSIGVTREHLSRKQLFPRCSLGFGFEDRALHVLGKFLLDVFGSEVVAVPLFDFPNPLAERRNLGVDRLVRVRVGVCLCRCGERNLDLYIPIE